VTRKYRRLDCVVERNSVWRATLSAYARRSKQPLFVIIDRSFVLSERNVGHTLFQAQGSHGGPPVKAGIAMFLKLIALLLAAILAYFLVQSDFDLDEAYFFLLLPASAILSYLVLGAAD
jgi:hypothetical protein